jgi:SHS2 domain-containing protein
MGEEPRRWEPQSRGDVYKELDHPADLFLEVWGRDLPVLFENTLFALYDQMAELERFEIERKETIAVEGPTPAEALRALLSEALYRFAAHGFVAIKAKIDVETTAAGAVQVVAHLDGETIDRQRHILLTEVKAVTYHQLTVEKDSQGGWRATVLFDV